MPLEPDIPTRFATSALDRGSVVFLQSADGENSRTHDLASKAAVARWIAALLDFEFIDGVDAERPPLGPIYLVPSETLIGTRLSRRLGIRDQGDLFGGVAPYPFVATKLITHPLVPGATDAPEGWSTTFGEKVRKVVLPGYSAFTLADALRAGAMLLDKGSVRIKEAGGVGGAGQYVVSDRRELQARLAAMDTGVLRRDGVVLERNLIALTTYSVGQVQVGDLLASYCGTQTLTRNHRGEEVYGGSTLHLVRGDWAGLQHIALTDEVRTAVDHAMVYHQSALESFDGLFMSRANYDVALGMDKTGLMHCGVLEQSWRIGGASGAEAVALHALQADPDLQELHASTRESYDADPVVPPGAWVSFSGDDDGSGPLTKFAWVHDHGDA